MRANTLRLFSLFIFFPVSLFCQTGEFTGVSERLPDCPKIEVFGPNVMVYPGETMEFRVIANDPEKKFRYRWSVNIGEIISEENAVSFLVRVIKGLDGRTVTANVIVEGLPDGCVNFFRESVSVNDAPIGEPLDGFGSMTPNDLKARVDAVYISLESNPTPKVFLVSHGKQADIIERYRLIREHVKFRKYDINRLFFIYAGEQPEIRTVVWLVPPEADIAPIF